MGAGVAGASGGDIAICSGASADAADTDDADEHDDSLLSRTGTETEGSKSHSTQRDHS